MGGPVGKLCLGCPKRLWQHPDEVIVAVELARCLVQGGVIATEEMESALLESLTTGLPLIRVLTGRFAATNGLLDRELGRLGNVVLQSVNPDLALCRRLPRGLCHRLLALPVTRKDPSLELDVAVADPFDAHAPEEIGYHLGRMVRSLQAPISEIFAALEMLAAPMNPVEPADEAADDRTPAFGTTLLPSFMRPDLPASAGRLGRPRAGNPESRFGPEPRTETAPLMLAASTAPDSEGDDVGASLETTLAKLERAEDPRAVTDVLVEGLQIVSGKVAVFSVRGTRFSGRALSASLRASAADQPMEIDAAESRILCRTLEAGHVLEPLREDKEDAKLGQLMDTRGGEVYASRIDVSGHPALVLVLASMTNAFVASQHADRLSRAARAALERIVVAKKTGR